MLELGTEGTGSAGFGDRQERAVQGSVGAPAVQAPAEKEKLSRDTVFASGVKNLFGL